MIKYYPKEIFVLCILVFAVYYNGLSGEFVMDDWPVIAENPKLDKAQYIPDYFSSGVWRNTGIGNEQDTFLYRPIFLFTLYIGKQLFGASPLGFHALDLALHLVNTILVYFLVIRLSKTKYRLLAVFATLFFALHPVHAESVSWIAGLTDPLVSCFVLSAFLLYLKHCAQYSTAHITKQSRLYLPLSLAFFSLALLSKENAVMLPFVIIAYVTLLGKEHGLELKNKATLIPISLFFAVLVIYFIVRKMALGSTIALSNFSLAGVFHLISFVGEYIKLIFIPWPLNYYYTIPENGILQIWGAILAVSIMATSIFFVTQRKFKDKIVLFSTCWIGLVLAPSLSLAFHAEPNFSIRYLYLPSAGMAFMLPYLIEPLFVRYKNITIIACCSILLGFSILTIDANRIWQNEFEFFSHATAITPQHAGPTAGLANYYQRNKQDQKAIEYYLKTIDLGDKAAKVAALENIGLIYGLSGDSVRSTEFYTKAYNIAPNRSTVLVGLGNNAWSRKDFQAARSFYEKAFLSDKSNYEAAFNLSILYKSLGDMNKAAYYETEALKLKR